MLTDTFATLFFAELLRFLAYELKDCNNRQDKEKEETPTGSRNGLLQSCQDWVTNRLPYFSREKVCLAIKIKYQYAAQQPYSD